MNHQKYIHLIILEKFMLKIKKMLIDFDGDEIDILKFEICTISHSFIINFCFYK